jgi:hypothetical protein
MTIFIKAFYRGGGLARSGYVYAFPRFSEVCECTPLGRQSPVQPQCHGDHAGTYNTITVTYNTVSVIHDTIAIAYDTIDTFKTTAPIFALSAAAATMTINTPRPPSTSQITHFTPFYTNPSAFPASVAAATLMNTNVAHQNTNVTNHNSGSLLC